MTGAYSIRQSLQGVLHDFVRHSGFTSVELEDLIREFVGLLASYREEGAPLYPEVYVFDGPAGLTALAPGGYRLVIGTTTLAAESATEILKNCAPLATTGWAIFAVRENQHLEYGLFRSARHSFATPAEESMRGLGKEAPIMLVRNRGHMTVELSSTVEGCFTVTLTTIPAQPSRLEADIEKFVDVVAMRLDDPVPFRAYLARLLTTVFQDCHGTLLGAVDSSPDSPLHASLTVGVWPTARVPLAELHKRAVVSGSADDLADLQGAEALLAGMINSDGVVVFGTDGSVMGFRVFLRPDEAEKKLVPDVGGGRRRTFELMKIRLESVFIAVFFRSQDGETLCERVNQ